MSGSVSWCWPPHANFTKTMTLDQVVAEAKKPANPLAVWYIMSYRDSTTLDQICGGSPTHVEKLAKMDLLQWEICDGEGKLKNVREPKR